MKQKRGGSFLRTLVLLVLSIFTIPEKFTKETLILVSSVNLHSREHPSVRGSLVQVFLLKKLAVVVGIFFKEQDNGVS